MTAARGIAATCVNIHARSDTELAPEKKFGPRNGGPNEADIDTTESLFRELRYLWKPRHLAAGGALVHHARLRGTHQCGFGRLQRRLRRLGIAGSDGFFDIADGGAHTGTARLVDLGPPRNFPGRLFGGLGIWHTVSRLRQTMTERCVIGPLKRETAAKSRRQLAPLIVRPRPGVNARTSPERRFSR